MPAAIESEQRHQYQLQLFRRQERGGLALGFGYAVTIGGERGIGPIRREAQATLLLDDRQIQLLPASTHLRHSGVQGEFAIHRPVDANALVNQELRQRFQLRSQGLGCSDPLRGSQAGTRIAQLAAQRRARIGEGHAWAANKERTWRKERTSSAVPVHTERP